jgi:hypothetical protein
VKDGDLVEFYSKSWVFRHKSDAEKNPGIIINCCSPSRFQVLWANKEITIEHACYLRSPQ